MITDLVKSYIFKIEINCVSWEKSKRGSCVIFKSKDEMSDAYLITAKHNLFANKEHIKNTQDTMHLIDKIIKISQNNKNINISSDSTAYFFKNIENQSFLDIAFIILKDLKNDIATLEICDTKNENEKNHAYYTGGYPNHLNDYDTDNKLEFYSLELDSTYQDNFERLKNKDGSLNFYDDEFNGNLQGMSGSGVFLLGRHNTKSLRSIIYKAIPTNKFECIKIDEILDKINEQLKKLGLPIINITTEPLSVNGEDFNLSDLAEIKSLRTKIQDSSTLKIENIKSAEDIKETAKKLNKSYHESKASIENLSYQYAHLALLADKEGMQLAKTRFFKKAIDLHPNHITTFLIEKNAHEQSKSADALNRIKPLDANGINKKYIQILSLENNARKRINIIKEAIEDLSRLDETLQKNEYINQFLVEIDKEYGQENRTKPIFKYMELADFCHNIPNDKLSLSYNYLSLELINQSINFNAYSEEKQKIEEKIKILERNIPSSLFEEFKNNAKKRTLDVKSR
jgi:hypothetical protein